VARRIKRQAIDQQKDHGRQQQVGDQRMPGQAVKKATSARHRKIIPHCEARGIHVGTATRTVEVIPVGVMHAVLAAPIGVGRERAEAAQSPGEGIGASRGEERAVPAIVLDNEDAYQQRAGRQRKGEGKQVGDRQNNIHRHAPGDERTYGSQKLQHRLARNGMREGGSSLSNLRH
jgi:hypothetical protein